MTPDDMARELRAAGWRQERGRMDWWHQDNIPTIYRPLTLERAWQELARARAQGTVTTPPAGQEE